MLFAYMCVCACVRACVHACVCACIFQHRNCTGWGSEGVNQEADKAYERNYASKTPGMGDSDVTFCMKTTICEFQFHV